LGAGVRPKTDFDLSFAARYELVPLERIPRTGEFGRAYGYPGAFALDPQQEMAAGPILGVRPAKGEPWVGVFAGGGYGVPPAAPEQVVGWPDEESFCVVKTGSGVVVRAREPRADREIDVFPICDVVSIPEPTLVIFANFTDLTAYGPEGIAWQSGRLVADDLKIVSLEGAHLRVSGYAWGADVEFLVDVATGVAPDKPDLSLI